MNGGGMMRIETIQLAGYQGIKEVELQFNGKNVVLFGENGTGKSSILQGTSLLFSRIINYVARNQFKQNINITREDVYTGERYAALSALFQLGDESLPYGFRYDKQKNLRLADRKVLSAFDKYYEAFYLDSDAPDHIMPIFIKYSVNRSVLDVPLRVRGGHTPTRLDAYRNAIEPKIDFRTFFEWVRNQSDIENQERVNRSDLSYTDPAMQSVREAISNMLPNVTNLQIHRAPLRMTVDKDGVRLTIHQLSDGEKCIIAMMGDIVRRLALANPHLEKPLAGTGIALIDEVELHLHPLWQRKIIPVLHKTFPNMQFIFTTHSPQVLGELDESFLVFHVAQAEESGSPHTTATQVPFAYFDSNLILEDYMHTSSVHEAVKETERQLFELLSQNDTDGARALLQRLRKRTMGSSPAITKAEILIRRGENKLK